MLRGGSVYYYARDNQGSVLALFNASMQVTHSNQYSPYGEIESASGSVPQPFRFTGREYDSETGLYYYRAKYYDPELGRFISEDPIGLEGGINLYAYVGNNPVNNRDPSGLYQQAADGDTIPIPLEGLVVTGKRQGGDVTVITFQSFPNARGGDNSDTCMVPESGGARFGQGGSAGARGAGAGGGQVTAQKTESVEVVGPGMTLPERVGATQRCMDCPAWVWAV
jgi:RHS repeat-associated protein